MIAQRIKEIALFLVACITSPCCTPVIVPLALALLTGTPLAVWLGTHLGWVYGGLTLVSAASLVLGLRQLNARKKPAGSSTAAGESPLRMKGTTHANR